MNVVESEMMKSAKKVLGHLLLRERTVLLTALEADADADGLDLEEIEALTDVLWPEMQKALSRMFWSGVKAGMALMEGRVDV